MGLSNDLSCEAGSFSCCCLNPQGVFNQRFEALFPQAGALGLRDLFCSPFVPPGLSACECVTAQWAISCLAGYASCSLSTLLHNPLPHWVLQPPPCCQSSPPSCVSPPPRPVWMNVSSLTPWLSDFHTVQFSVSSGCFCF